ncbi:MAG: phosphoribosylaminoimidazolesuccinocarboxamide synthase [Candidatus Aenigmarchaeota archaeon]|nr:phosphoribosylaminoimidazolesuccinocarboxamide synthase [Candidatus Aenigmarchaeota archaeon]
MGSVKDLVVRQHPSPQEMGSGAFVFSDRYSVFDWGEMPDHVPNKGSSLCLMSAYFFAQLNQSGIRTHYTGLDGNHAMNVHLVNVVKPGVLAGGYDYSSFRSMQGNFVIPFEIIYRNTLPKGSSVFKRLREGSLSLLSMGLTEQPGEGDPLPRMFPDISTKYEAFDRYPDERKGESRAAFLRDLGGLSEEEAVMIDCITKEANKVITDGIGHAGLRNDDGKLEFAFTPERDLMVVDAIGTLDECRFTYPAGGRRIEVSKEIPRQWYRYRQPEWVAEVEAAKSTGNAEWRALVTQKPEPLPPRLLELLGMAYASSANAVLGKDVFDCPPLDTVVREYQRFKEIEMK